MENFFCRFRTTAVLESEDHFYDPSGMVVDGVLCWETHKLAIPFPVRIFKVLQFDFILVSDNGGIFRVNKHCKLLEEIGQTEDLILGVYPSETMVLVVTTEELILFNAYFRLVGIKSLENKILFRTVVWADDLLCLVAEGESFIYTDSLDLVSSLKWDIKDAVFIQKYNKFACVVGDCIRFIEPNGLEHGDSLQIKCDKLALLNLENAQLLLAITDSFISAFYMKNFYWYQKFTIFARFYSVEGNSIITKDGLSYDRHYIYKEMSSSFVIDGNSLHYTDFSRAIIPPPFSMFKLHLEDTIQDFCFDGKVLYVFSGNSITKFIIKDGFSFQKQDSIALKVPALGYVNDLIILNGSPVVRIKDEIFAYDGGAFLPLDRKESRILKIYNFFEELAVLSADGVVYYHGEHAFNLNLTLFFKLSVVSVDSLHLVLQSGGCLQEYRVVGNDSAYDNEGLYEKNKCKEIKQIEAGQKSGHAKITRREIADVHSFIIYKDYLIYNNKDKLVVEKNGTQKSSSFADAELQLLTVSNDRIISQMRFGSLETTTCKLFSRERIKALLKEAKYSEAAAICDREHVDYEIFYEDGRCPVEVINCLSDKEVYSLVSALNINTPVYHENDTLERLRSMFDVEAIYCGKEVAKDLSGTACVLLNDATKHLFKDGYKQPIRDVPCKALDTKILVIDLKEPEIALNVILSNVSIEKHFNTVVGLFIDLGRVDLCFYLDDLPRAIKVLTSRISTNDIIKAAARSMSLDKISLALNTMQCDSAQFEGFFRTRSQLEFSIFEYLEDRKNALYSFIKSSQIKNENENELRAMEGLRNINISNEVSIKPEILEYAEKHNLFDELLMYQFYGLFNYNFYFCVAKRAEPMKAFELYRLAGADEDALAVALDNLLWERALEYYRAKETQIQFAEKLEACGRQVEAGVIYDRFIGDKDRAFRLYLIGGDFKRALAIYKQMEDEERCADAAGRLGAAAECALRNEIGSLYELKEAYEKYKDRLGRVQERLETGTDMSQTSFTTTSSKSIRNALLKDRPGGVYEYEYVLNKIRETVIAVVDWRENTEQICAVFRELGQHKRVLEHDEAFKRSFEGLREEIDMLWNYKRHDYDPNRPVISKPGFTKFFK